MELTTDFLNRSIEFIFISLMWFSVMSCLARTDYNFGFAIFCYYLWISKEEKQNNLILIIINGLLILIDIIFLLTVGSIWGKTVQGDDAWNSLSGIHGFALTTSVIELLLKVCVIVLLYLLKKKQQTGDFKQPLIGDQPNSSGLPANKI